ncbi:hypothetical protein Ancab_007133 [Ancistrocladus abbreviatus]
MKAAAGIRKRMLWAVWQVYHCKLCCGLGSNLQKLEVMSSKNRFAVWQLPLASVMLSAGVFLCNYLQTSYEKKRLQKANASEVTNITSDRNIKRLCTHFKHQGERASNAAARTPQGILPTPETAS